MVCTLQKWAFDIDAGVPEKSPSLRTHKEGKSGVAEVPVSDSTCQKGHLLEAKAVTADKPMPVPTPGIEEDVRDDGSESNAEPRREDCGAHMERKSEDTGDKTKERSRHSGDNMDERSEDSRDHMDGRSEESRNTETGVRRGKDRASEGQRRLLPATFQEVRGRTSCSNSCYIVTDSLNKRCGAKVFLGKEIKE
ncbi:hypothetical protein NDU88_004201 [Pleurodeles waltl]|uniref:Uncharacterized protein n=1 Tax=Pleurodeles waltl TaxID=8319 RepID=A0AAV7SI31_PLEWA|nr:hypothetical protein NDU88_004201 [Pleurodeles waltl]